MKHLFTSILFVFISIIAYNQSFHIRFDDSDEILKNGATLHIEHNTNTLIQKHMYIHNLSDHDIDITVKRHDSILPEGMESMFCLNVCYTPATLEATHTVSRGDSVFFTVDLYPYNLTGNALIEYTVVNEPDMDTVHFYVQFIVTPVGIENMTTKNYSIYPNPAKDIIYIPEKLSFENTTIKIYATNGRLLQQKTLHAFDNRIDVTSLNPGIYFLSIFNESKMLHKEKIIIQK